MYNNCIIFINKRQQNANIFYIHALNQAFILPKSRYILQNIIALPSKCIFRGKKKAHAALHGLLKRGYISLKAFLICVLSGPIPLYIIYSIIYRVKYNA